MAKNLKQSFLFLFFYTRTTQGFLFIYFFLLMLGLVQCWSVMTEQKLAVSGLSLLLDNFY